MTQDPVTPSASPRLGEQRDPGRIFSSPLIPERFVVVVTLTLFHFLFSVSPSGHTPNQGQVRTAVSTALHQVVTIINNIITGPGMNIKENNIEMRGKQLKWWEIGSLFGNLDG